MITPYFSESEINHRSLPSCRIKKKIRGLEVAVDDSTGVDIAQRSEHATKVLSDSFYG